MDSSFAILSDIIKGRRSTKPGQMNGSFIPDEQVEQLLELADWAPTHGNTEPWRFVVYAGEKAKAFCLQHAELYKSYTPAQNFLQANYDKILRNGDNVSHIIVAINQRGKMAKIPVIEEEAATSAAIQNILIGATALGIASFWSTGGLTHHPTLKDYFELGDDDTVMGILYLGYTDITQTGKRIVPLTEKVKWIS